ncbi:SDR family NAD(P)-dependent oxidoreductase [Marinobacter halodurans]|uniref:SDR family NAD(P)-dependent oxidoreductase n=1 Tax=Marinobacter halodurans TaxID=2528979 RepID=A0ABY1ZFZ7_9GAMM|nr:SDR family NAD(P)-dependent oxidoreductase [Marinobacter halodurans]TBW50335.1 SDR family NAD(P)-dependent oxidoreductase [Marinobacter halodurans]
MDIKKGSVLITGASSGFGLATAKRFLSEGIRVIAIARRMERLNELKEEHGDQVLVGTVDVRNKDEVEGFLSKLEEPFSNIDCLINNAGLSLGFGPAQSNSLDDWEQIIDTNIKGLLYCTHAVLPSMIKKDRGQIINIGSIAAYYPYVGGNVYAASKAFVNSFSLNLKSDLTGTGVRVCCVAPGMSKTEFALVRFKGDQSKANALYSGKEYLRPEDVAESVYWCYAAPAHVNINVLEVIPTRQHFSLGFPTVTG